MKARKVLHKKTKFEDGAIREMVIWQLSETTKNRPHGIKYRLYYGKEGQRLVGYDNETGKGDHRHFLGKEFPYKFENVEKLLADFKDDIQSVRQRNG